MSPRLIRKYCAIAAESKGLLENAITRIGLSARAYDRILKVSRTLADLEGKEAILHGSVEITPAVVHWKAGHFAALTKAAATRECLLSDEERVQL